MSAKTMAKIIALRLYYNSPRICGSCGESATVRPFGVNGTDVCIPCARLNQEETTRQMLRYLYEEEPDEGYVQRHVEENPL